MILHVPPGGRSRSGRPGHRRGLAGRLAGTGRGGKRGDGGRRGERCGNGTHL